MIRRQNHQTHDRARVRAVHLRWTALLLAIWLVLVQVPPAGAQTEVPPPPEPDGLGVLLHYGLIKGDGNGDLRPGDPITRGELAALLVRAVGKEGETQFFAGQDPFKDIRTHWARGHIALAARMGLVRGYADGSFQPKRPVNYVEVLAMLLRLVGQEPADGVWPQVITDQAARLGIAPPAFTNLNAAANQPAARLHVFQSLYLTMAKVPAGPDGRTLLQRIDPVPPVLAVDPIPSPTDAGLAQVRGSAPDAHWVRVGTRYVTLSQGRFQTDVPLHPGTNEIQVEAADLAGNRASQTLTVVRGEPLARLEVAGPDQVALGEQAAYRVSGFDTSGDEVPVTGLTVQVEDGIGTFDLSTMRFTAGTRAGVGKLVFTAQGVEASKEVTILGPAAEAAKLAIQDVNDGRPVGAGQSVTVRVQVLDRSGQPVAADTGRTVTLTVSGIKDATVQPATATTRGGIASFTIQAPSAGTLVLQARSERLQDGRQEVRILPPVRVRLTADPSPLDADGYSQSRVTATLVDANNRPVENDSGRDVVIELTRSGASATLDDPVLRIAPRQSRSSATAELTAGMQQGKAVLSGTVVSGQPYPVDTLEIPLVSPQRGEAVAIEVKGPGRTAKAGEAATYTVRVVDGYGQPVKGGRYAFRIRVRAEHDEGTDTRLPEGITARIGVIDLDPASGLVARTRDGVANIVITSDRSGVVQVDPVLLPPVDDGAYDDQGVAGAAGGTQGLRASGGQATFIGTPAGLVLQVDSVLGTKADHGAIALKAGATAIVRVLVVDSKGARVPGAKEKVTLVQSGSATLAPSLLEHETADGMTTYLIRSGSTAGTDVYSATHAKLGPSQNSVFLTVQDQAPATPQLIAVRGAREGIPGDLNRVAAADDTMEVEVLTEPGVGVLRVYRSRTSEPIYTTAPLDLTGGRTVISVPKERVPYGQYTYEVTLQNAVGESPRSTASAAVLNEKYSSSTLTQARYDATTHQLLLVGSGYSTRDGLVRPERITIVGSGGQLNLAGAGWQVKSSGTIALDLSGLPAVLADLEDPAKFGGPDVHLELDPGWYDTNGGLAARGYDNIALSPMAQIAAAYLDLARKVLDLEGAGFASGTLDPRKIKVVNQANGQEYALSGLKATRSGDGRWTITLTNAAVQALSDSSRFGGSQMRLVTENGWLANAGSGAVAMPGGNALYYRIGLIAARYDSDQAALIITGTGLAGGTVHPDLLEVQDLDGGTPLSLAGATADPPTAGQIVIHLTPTQISDLTGGGFAGSNIYLVAQTGWWEKGGWSSGPVPAGVLRMEEP